MKTKTTLRVHPMFPEFATDNPRSMPICYGDSRLVCSGEIVSVLKEHKDRLFCRSSNGLYGWFYREDLA